jgi:membrane protein DedA with SNARE-associated domain
MSALLDFLLTQVINSGAPLFAAALLIGAVGIPIPTTLLVVAVGAFVQQGLMTWPDAAALGLLAAVAGDSLSFGIGRYARRWIPARVNTSTVWLSAETRFNQQGGWAVFLTRFLVTSVAIPVNLLAGSGAFPFVRFLAYDFVGELVWLAGYGALGYAFGTQWELVGDFIGNFGGLVLGVLILAAGIYMALKWSQRNGPA